MPETAATFVKTGISEMDDVMGGGLTPSRVYLLHGTPGAGKTTLAMQFLMEGVRNGEKVLYVTLSETRAELLASARSHGWNLDGMDIFELVAQESDLQLDNQYTMYEPAEVQMGETTRMIIERISQTRPSRCVVDSLSELKLLAQNMLRYRRQVLALKQFFIGRNCTTLLLDDKTATRDEDRQLESIAHGVISLEQLSPEYGADRRRLRITKMRGQQYRGGYHDYAIRSGGLAVFPRLVAAEHVQALSKGILSSGIKELDAMLHGGLKYGKSMLLLGPAGSGKSSLAMNFAFCAAEKGDRVAVFSFDERTSAVIDNMAGIGLDIQQHIDNRLFTVQSIDPAELSPGEFTHYIKSAVDGTDGYPPAGVVVIDSMNGYMNAMPEEHFLSAQMHELLTYLGHKNVVTVLVMAQHGLLGTAMQTPIDTSYLADSVILLRFFEFNGEVRQALSVLKMRGSKHERTIRELKIDSEGVRIGEALTNFHGVLTGTPVYAGEQDKLMSPR